MNITRSFLSVSVFLLGAAGCTASTSAPVEATGRASSAETGDLCVTNDDCDFGEYCRTPEGLCGGIGGCAPRGITLQCKSTKEPVCGCDGLTYDNRCLAEKAGAAVDHCGACEGDVKPATECVVDSDCKGVLAQFCVACGDGGSVCNHWSCVAGQCTSGAVCPK